MSFQKVKLFKLAIPLVLLLVIAGCGGGGENDGPIFSITLAVGAVTTNSVTLTMVSRNVSGTMSVMRDGVYVADVDMLEGVQTGYTDSNLASGTRYCYKVGGLIWPFGWLWSNEVCVTTL